MSVASTFKFYQHTEHIYYTDSYYTKVKAIRKHISDECIAAHKVPDLFQIITDFDHTLTHPLSYQCHGLIAEFAECPKFVECVKSLFGNFKNKYPEAKPEDFWSMYHEHMKEHQFEYRMIEQLLSVRDRLYLRDHCVQLFSYCHDKGIPILIVSAGIANVIQCILERHGLIAPKVFLIANRIYWNTSSSTRDEEEEEHFDGNGFHKKIQIPAKAKIKRFGKLLTSFNKHDTYRYLKSGYFDKHDIMQRKFVLLLGDSKRDPHTMHGIPQDNVHQCICIGFILPHRLKEIDEFLTEYDVVIATKHASLEFVNDVLHALLNGDHVLSESEQKQEAQYPDNELDTDTVSELQKLRAHTHPNTFTYSLSDLRVDGYTYQDDDVTEHDKK